MSKRTAAAASASASSSPALAEGADNPLKWQQALSRDVEWRKSDLLDVIYGLRQVLGVICGIVWGIIPLTGLPAILLFLGVNAALLFVYYTKYLGVDDEDESYGRMDLLTEGLWPSFAMFVLTWICVYSIPL